MINTKKNKYNGRFEKTPPIERFLFNIQKLDNGCWEWKNYRDKDGYGQFFINKRPSIPAHRACWILFIGKIPKGICVLHKCDNPPCVNPEHLYLGTHKDNAEDRKLKDRGVKGEKVNTNILTKEQVIYIRKSFRNRHELATLFGVTYSTISDIINFRSWKWLKL